MIELKKDKNKKTMYVYIDSKCVEIINYSSIQDLMDTLNRHYHSELLEENKN